VTERSNHSCHLAPISCIHTGNFSQRSSTFHIGIDIAGNHAKFAGTVYKSSKYINNELFVFSQNLLAGVGVVGVKTA
jgi:hypothetical protein